MTSAITSRWFLSLRRKVNEGIFYSTRFSAPDGQQSKTIISDETGPEFRFERRGTGVNPELSKTTSGLEGLRSQFTMGDIENENDMTQKYLAKTEEEPESYLMETFQSSVVEASRRNIV